MKPQTTTLAEDKISPNFAARLRRFQEQEKVRAVVLLSIPSQNVKGLRPSRAERQAFLVAIREAAFSFFPEIDRILEHFGGRRISPNPSVLGTVPIETTVAGIEALAACEYVKAILEDQTLALIR